MDKKEEDKRPEDQLLPLTISLIAIVPSTTIGLVLKDHDIPVEYAQLVATTILLLAAFNFATVIIAEHYSKMLSRMTMPALIGSTAIIFMYVIAASLNRFVVELGYHYITPFLFGVILYDYLTILREKIYTLKFFISLNTIALFILWAMGTAKTFTMPF